jgi:hypothetical protein
VGGALPDLVVSADRLAREVRVDDLAVDASACVLLQGCVAAPGLRRLLRFGVEATNQGGAALLVAPQTERPELYALSACDGRYHLGGFAEYQLLDAQGRALIVRRAPAPCVQDSARVGAGPGVPCDPRFDCARQGLLPGWSVLWGNTLDCQWLDVTDVPPGAYQLRVVLNPARVVEEASLENNAATVPVVIPAR